MAQKGAGLEGVIAAESRICFIDGEQGILAYRGYDIHTLAENATFEEVVFLLWNGRLPSADELAGLKKSLMEERGLPVPVIDFLRDLPQQVKPMDVLRTAVSMLGIYDPPGTAGEKAIRLVA